MRESWNSKLKWNFSVDLTFEIVKLLFRKPHSELTNVSLKPRGKSRMNSIWTFSRLHNFFSNKSKSRGLVQNYYGDLFSPDSTLRHVSFALALQILLLNFYSFGHFFSRLQRFQDFPIIFFQYLFVYHKFCHSISENNCNLQGCWRTRWRQHLTRVSSKFL